MLSSKSVWIGNLEIGGKAPLRVESMLKIPLSDLEECLKQVARLEKEGCELIRVALPSVDFVDNLKRMCAAVNVELMADIHFDPRLAIAAIESGCHSIRINPGNMGEPSKLGSLVHIAKESGTVIRIGANSGSVSRRQLEEAGGDQALGLVYALEEQLRFLLKNDFNNVILSAKSTSVAETIRANTLIAQRYPDLPMHIGITEAGPGIRGIARSSAGIGIMLSQGIGDTIRVSLSEEPEMEVQVGYEILRSLGLRSRGVEIISCPTCGRKRMDVKKILPIVMPMLACLPDGTKVAVMGCEVNGPKEAKDADIGVAGSPKGAIIFSKGKVIEDCSIEELPKRLRSILKDFESNV